MDPSFASIAETAVALRRGRIGARELVQAHLDRIGQQASLAAYVAVCRDRALAAAGRAQERLRDPDAGPLTGIPIAVKDIIDVAGLPTRCQSRIMPDVPASDSAPVVSRLEAAGAVVLGKTALHEFATGWPGFDLPFPPARNPWNRERHPGGSSSGSAVAVAAGMAMGAVGTDTAGSIRNPATACGIVGLKPTYDLVPRAGTFPLAFSLDQVGPMARSTADCSLLLDAMADRHEATPFGGEIGMSVEGLRIGVLDAVHAEAGDLDPEVARGFDLAVDTLRRLGVKLVSVRIPSFAAFQTCLRIIQQAESHAVHRDWLMTRPGDYGATAREKLAAGALVSGADFVIAQQARRELTARYRKATSGLDAIVAVSSLHRPCGITDAVALAATYDRHVRGIFNVTGDPAIAVPVGFSADGLPLGVQLAAGPWRERHLLRIAHALETALGANRIHPPRSVRADPHPSLEPVAGRA